MCERFKKPPHSFTLSITPFWLISLSLSVLRVGEMDPKQLALPGQLLSPRRKVVSGFGLCFGVTIFIFSVSLLSSPLHERFMSPLFRGFYNVRSVGSSSIVSWPFSFSRPFASNASNGVNSSVDSVPKAAQVVEGMSGDTQLRYSTDRAINESFRVESPANKVLSNSSENGAGLGRTHLGTTSQVLSKGSLSDEGGGKVSENFSVHGNEDTNAKTAGGKSSENNSVAVNKVTEIANVGNVSLSGEIDGSNPEGDRVNRDEGVVSLNECDIFDGRWVRDDSKPYYPAGSCPHIDRDFNCHRNGRPDDGFAKWKWQPNGCDIPSLNATDFLERLRGKKLVFVGDSLNRNMWESLVCILRHSIRRKNRVYEISGRREFKKKGFYAFRFEDYDCTVDFVGSPFLVRESSFRSGNATLETLRLDLMDKTTSMYQDADIIVFNTGHWWTHEKTSRGEDYYQEGNYVYPRLKVLEAYKRALLTWVKWIDKNIDSNRTQVFFRGYSVTHFRGGQWNSGGQCHSETEPIYNTSFLAKYPSKMKVLQHVLEDMKTPVVYLNISRLTDYRKDGHPSIYRMEYKTEEQRIAAQRSQDCSHWCLPGVPDTWNELLYASLLKAGRGSWRT